jgi:hypothetical protein
MPTILRDKVTVSHVWGTHSFNDPTTLGASWPNALDVRIDDLGPGWLNSADLRVVSSPRGVGDGDYVANRFAFKSRMLNVEGYINASSRANLDALWDLMQVQAFPENVDITLTRYEPVPKFVVGRLAGELEVVQYFGNEGSLRFSTTILCADPFKYDAVNTITGGPVGVSGISTGGRTYPRVYPLVYNITAGGAVTPSRCTTRAQR